MEHLVTSLLGRRTIDGGTIVAVFCDRGEMKLVVENKDGQLYESNVYGTYLEKE